MGIATIATISSERIPTEEVRIGNADICLRDCGDFYVERDYIPAQLSRSVTITDRFGERFTLGNNWNDTLEAFDTALQKHRHTMNAEVMPRALEVSWDCLAYPVIILTPESYRACFTDKDRPPEWAGVSVRDGHVVYNGVYVNAVLAGDGYYGGYYFSPDYWYREHMHETRHLDDLVGVFGRHPGIAGYFAGNSLFVTEGMCELLPGITQSSYEFRTHLLRQLTRNPEFSTAELTHDFFHIDGTPAGVNFAYQYSARWMHQLSGILAQVYYRKFAQKDVPIVKPYEAVYDVLVLARDRYLAGARESYYSVIEERIWCLRC